MAVDIHKLIAAINPDVYCKEYDETTSKPIRKVVKRIVKEEGYLKAAEKAELVESSYMDIWNTRHTQSAFALAGLKNPIEKHSLVYDSSAQSLEPIYFWIIDNINFEYGRTYKLVDNFLASAGSGHFSELQARATRMQEEAMKMFGAANTVVKSVLNILYNLKEFKLRLAQYEDYHSKDEKTRRAALYSLKQIWLDRVDIQRGTSSIKALATAGANQPNFITLIDAFMVADSLEALSKLDLNERVKRLLEQRLSEFLRWLKQSESELTKRFEIEKKYLKAQVSTLKLYARWIKPYLKAARQLEQHAESSSSLVNVFNTALFELTIVGEAGYSPEQDIQAGELPESWRKIKIRKYFPIIIIEFKFRSVPERADQRGGYGYRGRAEITFTSYALNEDEIKVLKEQVEKDDLGDIYQLIEGATTESLAELQNDIDEFLNDKPSEKKQEKSPQDVNPFTALFSFLSPKKEEKSSEKSKQIKKDTDVERVIRSQVAIEARTKCRKAYDDYKGANEMPRFPPGVESMKF